MSHSSPGAPRDAYPPGWVDVHCHVLPGIDDGSADAEESLAFCRMAREDGVAVTVATPHVREETYPNTIESIRASFEEFQGLLAERGETHRVVIGGEVFLRPDIPELHRHGLLPTCAGLGRSFLLELPDFFPEEAVARLVAECAGSGLRPVIAHPERIVSFLRRPELLYRLIRFGALAQVTALSLTGGFGRDAARTAAWFVERRWAHLLASDAHNTFLRSPVLGFGVDAARRLVGEEEALALVDATPRALVEGRDPEVQEPGHPEPPRRTLLARIFGG